MNYSNKSIDKFLILIEAELLDINVDVKTHPFSSCC